MLRSYKQIERCLLVIDRFGFASGSRINRSKTIALVSEQFQSKQNIRKDINVQTEVDKVLGVPIGKGELTKFWKEKIIKIKSIFGKCVIYRCLVKCMLLKV